MFLVINIFVATEILYTRPNEGPLQLVALDRLPGSCIYLPRLHSTDGPTFREHLNSGIQRLLFNSEVTYGSLYLVVWVIFHCFYKNEGLPLVYKSTQVSDTCGWVVKSTAGSKNRLSRLLALSRQLLPRRRLKTRKALGNCTLLFSAFCQDVSPTSLQTENHFRV